MIKWLTEQEQPNLEYYIEFQDGIRVETDSALQLFDVVCEPGYADCDDRVTQLIMLIEALKRVAVLLAMDGIKADVYDGVGRIFSNNENQEQSENIEFLEGAVMILDGWDERTTIKSLIKCGYMKMYEKVPTFTSEYESNCSNCEFYNVEQDHCNTWNAGESMSRFAYCPFWTCRNKRSDYQVVDPDEIRAAQYDLDYLEPSLRA